MCCYRNKIPILEQLTRAQSNSTSVSWGLFFPGFFFLSHPTPLYCYKLHHRATWLKRIPRLSRVATKGLREADNRGKQQPLWSKSKSGGTPVSPSSLAILKEDLVVPIWAKHFTVFEGSVLVSSGLCTGVSTLDWGQYWWAKPAGLEGHCLQFGKKGIFPTYNPFKSTPSCIFILFFIYLSIQFIPHLSW